METDSSMAKPENWQIHHRFCVDHSFAIIRKTCTVAPWNLLTNSKYLLPKLKCFQFNKILRGTSSWSRAIDMYYTSCSPFHNRRGSCGWRRGTGPWCSLEKKQDNLIFCVSCGTKFSELLIFPIFCSSFCDLPKTKLPPKLNPLAKLYTRKSHVKSRLRCIFLKRLFLSEIKWMKLETKLQENKRRNFSRLNTEAIMYQVVP